MGFPLQIVKLFNYYRRYKWNEDDFAILQDTLFNYQATINGMANVIYPFQLQPNGSSGLNFNFLSGFAMNNLGNLLYSDAGSVAVTDNIKSLVVIRPVNTNTTPITRPTAPFDPVFLNYEQSAEVVSIDGTISAYPSALPGDVILAGIVASGGVITLIDRSQAQLIGKGNLLGSTGFLGETFVGNLRNCNYLTLADALANVAAGARIRVWQSETVDATIMSSLSNVEIVFNPGVNFTAGAAATGFNFSGVGMRIIGGRFTGFGTTAFNLSGNYSQFLSCRFSGNTNDILDSTATASIVGVINE